MCVVEYKPIWLAQGPVGMYKWWHNQDPHILQMYKDCGSDWEVKINKTYFKWLKSCRREKRKWQKANQHRKRSKLK